MSELKQSVAMLQAFAKRPAAFAPCHELMARMEPHVPPPLVALQELKREPVSEARAFVGSGRRAGAWCRGRALLAAPGACGEPVGAAVGGGVVRPQELTGLLFTVAFGDEAEALMAISSGQPLDAKDAIGRTALHCAASRGSAAISRMLLDA